jgi:MoxR-like ATPase
MDYQRLFDSRQKPATRHQLAGHESLRGDRRDGRVYIYTDEIELAVNLALATSRPLLVRGPSGSGKSSLAQSVAYILGWRYYEDVSSSRTQAQDLLWRFDTVRRLSDALERGRDVSETGRYIQPGVLWWAFDRESAARLTGQSDPTPWVETADAPQAVVLIDEIDKADPDVPNNLLVPLGSFRFSVPELKTEVVAGKLPLVVITTNDERELPNAFLRRCVVTTLKRPERQRLIDIANEHFGADESGLYGSIADVLASVASVKDKRGQPTPSTAEYLDAIAVSSVLDIKPGDSAEWQAMVSAMFIKPRTADDAA